jgi:putative PEP-CTERM system TPR-repeat lipoprotein
MNIPFRAFGRLALAVLAAWLIAGCAQKPEALLASAKERLAKDDRPAAIIQLRNALQKNPNLAEARFLLGKSLLETGDVLGAEKELRRAAELQYPEDQVVPLLARALVTRGDYKKAIGEFGNVKLASPESMADLQASLGKARLGLGDAGAAKTSFEAALSTQTDFPPALVGEARIKASAEDYAGALALVDAALGKEPNLTEGWQLKGDILAVQKQNDAALAAYRKALETKPDYVPAHYALVSLLMRDNKTADANKAFEAMKKVAPKSPQTLYLQAAIAYHDKNYAAARDAIQLQLKAAPGNLPGLLLGAQIDYQFGSYAQVETALSTVLQFFPRESAARRLLAQTYLREGKPDKAKDVLDPILHDGQPDSDTLAIAGEVYLRNGDAAAAADYFEKSAALDPKNPSKRLGVAISHLAEGEGERGVGELEAVAAEDSGVRADLALVATNLRQKKFDAALAAVNSIEKKQPNTALPKHLRGVVLLAKRDVPGARKSFEEAVAIDPTYLPAIANLARLDVADKKPDAAKKRYESVLAKDPKNAQALLALAELRAQTGGTPDEVAAMIGKAITANPADPTPRLALVSYWLRSKEPKKALTAAQDALAAMPERPEILDAAARAYRDAGDANQAINTYTKLAQLQPNSPLPYMRIAEINMAANDNNAAISSLRKALELKPDLIEAQRALVALYIGSGRTKDALAAARDVQKRRPNDAVGYVLEGQVHTANKDWAQAESVYRAGLKEAGSPELATYLYSALTQAGKEQEASKFAAAWLKDHPADIPLRQYLAQVALDKKDYASAAKYYQAMLAAQPDNALILNNLAWVSGQLKDPKAIEYAERAYQLAPSSPAILDTLGMLVVEKGDVARGIELLKKASELQPGNGAIRLNYASALAKSGQKDAAKKELDAVAKLGGGFAAQADTAKLMLGL